MRPLAFWLEESPPGWVSNCSADAADPIVLASQIHRHLQAFIQWLRQPEAARWETHRLQSFSAALFNRYPLARPRASVRAAGTQPDQALLELNWPAGSDDVRRCLRELQQSLAAPLAVFKAIQVPASACLPTRDELRMAEAELVARLREIEAIASRLSAAIHDAIASSAPARRHAISPALSDLSVGIAK